MLRRVAAASPEEGPTLPCSCEGLRMGDRLNWDDGVNILAMYQRHWGTLRCVGFLRQLLLRVFPRPDGMIKHQHPLSSSLLLKKIDHLWIKLRLDGL